MTGLEQRDAGSGDFERIQTTSGQSRDKMSRLDMLSSQAAASLRRASPDAVVRTKLIVARARGSGFVLGRQRPGLAGRHLGASGRSGEGEVVRSGGAAHGHGCLRHHARARALRAAVRGERRLPRHHEGRHGPGPGGELGVESDARAPASELHNRRESW